MFFLREEYILKSCVYTDNIKVHVYVFPVMCMGSFLLFCFLPLQGKLRMQEVTGQGAMCSEVVNDE